MCRKPAFYKLAAEEKTTESSQVIRTVNSILGNFGYWLVATGDSGNRVYKLAAEEKTTESVR
ncbi:hypothetical protein CXB77_05610 [Chromatium okenii]|uniref:Uncharacterized protein n=1 Tax=Chromatium okenii TaxID=61644 RepID=A0A2S7XTR9_9GAMM|nr:hypothetical protein CXB77_05610 [Chromatium okenii]